MKTNKKTQVQIMVQGSIEAAHEFQIRINRELLKYNDEQKALVIPSASSTGRMTVIINYIETIITINKKTKKK